MITDVPQEERDVTVDSDSSYKKFANVEENRCDKGVSYVKGHFGVESDLGESDVPSLGDVWHFEGGPRNEESEI